MLNRSQACAALIICTSVAFAQDAITPSSDMGNSSGSGGGISPLIAPSSQGLQLQTGDIPAADQKPPATESDRPGFLIPGGFGNAPVNFTPGEGKFDRKPLSFGTTIQQSYDDNTNSSSGAPGSSPIKGSMSTTLSEGMSLLLSQDRLGLSLESHGGGQYYWDRAQGLAGNGDLDLIFAYQLSPRAQLSALVKGTYSTQPSLSVSNGLVNSKGSSYLLVDSNLNLLYRWTPRVSTGTSYVVNALSNQASQSQSDDHVTQTVGQSLRYDFSRRVTGVLEARAAQVSYTNSVSDSNTYSLLGGADMVISRRFSGTIRMGTSTQEYSNQKAPSTTSPSAEGSLNYNVTRASTLSLSGRYGFDDSSSQGQSRKTLRTGASYTRVLTHKLQASISANYIRTEYTLVAPLIGSTPATDESYSGSMGLQYAYSQNLSISGNVSRLWSTPAQTANKYTKDTFSLGLSYQY